jgi:hypothetical protein
MNDKIGKRYKKASCDCTAGRRHQQSLCSSLASPLKRVCDFGGVPIQDLKSVNEVVQKAHSSEKLESGRFCRNMELPSDRHG